MINENNLNKMLDSMGNFVRRKIIMQLYSETTTGLLQKDLWDIVRLTYNDINDTYLSQANFNKHLRQLKSLELIKQTYEGKKCVVLLTEKGKIFANMLEYLYENAILIQQPYLLYQGFFEVAQLVGLQYESLKEYFLKKNYKEKQYYDKSLLIKNKNDLKLPDNCKEIIIELRLESKGTRLQIRVNIKIFMEEHERAYIQQQFMKLRDNDDVVTAITLAFVEIINDLRYIWENINKEDSVKFQNTLVKIIKNPINQKDIRFRSE